MAHFWNKALASLILAGSVIQASAAKRLTVLQLRHLLESFYSRPDREAAQQISELQLTERLNPSLLNEMIAHLPGNLSKRALVAIADQSAFVDPPKTEIPTNPAPPVTEQRHMMNLVVGYVTRTIPQLPNFLATRTTDRFEDTPHIVGPYEPIHFVETSEATVLYRDGREVEDRGTQAPNAHSRGLSSQGEFGYILSAVLLDAAQNKLEWMRWEQSSSTTLAVFAFSVPREKSHFEINYCCVADSEGHARNLHEFVGYSGHMAIDPQVGTIMRIVINADLKPGHPVSTAHIAVDYGPVEIGGGIYTCPVHSIAFSRAQGLSRQIEEIIPGAAHGQVGGNPSAHVKVGNAPDRAEQSLVNDIVFSNYHVFRSESHIVANEGFDQPASTPPAAIHEKDTDTAAAYSALSNSNNAYVPAPTAPSNVTVEAAPTQTASSNALAPLSNLAAFLPAQTPAGSSDQPIFKATTREVVVDVVVTGGKGGTVNGLRKEQFQVFEDGKPQTIDFFEEHASMTRPAGSLPTPSKMPPNVYTNVPPAPVDDAVNVLLLDSLNTPPQMAAYARNEILGYLNNVKPGTRMAIVVLNDKLNFVQGFTTDAALLREVALKQTAPGTSPSLVTKSKIADEQELESFLGGNAPAAPGVAAVSGSTANGNNASTPMAATMGVVAAFAHYKSYKSANRTRMTLEAISGIARYLAAVPGRKNLIWFAGDFPVVIFPKFDQRMEDENNAITLQEVHKAANLLTAARVAVYPVYANGMMLDDIVSADNRSPASAAPPGRMSSVAGMDNNAASHNDRAGLISAMNQIASDTGGKAVYNTNDLDSAISRSVADGSHYYTLIYSPANKKMDGHYRKIEVKVADSKLKLGYRRGYNADDDAVLAQYTQQDTGSLLRQLVHGMPNATQILFAARVVPVTPQPAPGGKIAGSNASLSGPTTRYSIDFFIRWSDVALAAGADGTHEGKVEVGLIAWDTKGKSVNWEEDTQQMALKPDVYAAIQKSGIPAHMEIDLPNTDLYLKLGVVDGTSGKAGTLEVALHPANATTASASSVQPKNN
jgi:VWFA-related protein